MEIIRDSEYYERFPHMKATLSEKIGTIVRRTPALVCAAFLTSSTHQAPQSSGVSNYDFIASIENPCYISEKQAYERLFCEAWEGEKIDESKMKDFLWTFTPVFQSLDSVGLVWDDIVDAYKLHNATWKEYSDLYTYFVNGYPNPEIDIIWKMAEIWFVAPDWFNRMTIEELRWPTPSSDI